MSLNPLEGDLTSLFNRLALEGKGVSFFLFTLTPAHRLDSFPVPTLPAIDGFMQFSEADAALVPERVFNPAHHLFRTTNEQGQPVLILGVIGIMPAVFNWADQWLQNLSKSGLYELWAKHAQFIPSVELI